MSSNEYNEIQKICSRYEVCSKCPYRILTISNNGFYVYKCILKNK